jgi:hypothetical protein
MKKSLLVLGLMIAGGAFAQTPRMSLYEEFTGETCPPCAATNPGLNALLASPTNTPKVIALKWQVPIPSAPTKTWSLYQTNKTEIDWRWSQYGYGINSAPSGRMDGRNVTFYGAASDHPANLNNSIISTAQSYTSPFSISMTHAWNKYCTAINVTITIQASANYTSTGALYFRNAMIERNINFSVQPGTNGEKDFEDIVIKCFPNYMGTTLPTAWTTGQSQTFTMSCTLPSYTRKKSEVALVGFIQDDGNRTVQQAMRANPLPMPNIQIGMLGAKVAATCNSTITPDVILRNDGTSAITNMTITPYIDGTAAAAFPWSGNLAAGATTTINIPSLATGTALGSHTFSYNVELAASPYNLTAQLNSVNYMVASTIAADSVVQGFLLGTFPPAGFAAINPNNGPGWSRATNAGGYNITPLNSLKYDFFNNTVIGDQDEFYLPPVDLTGGADPLLDFEIAYSQRTSTSNDNLEIFASKDCGATWTSIYQNNGSTLATVSGFTGINWAPNVNDPTNWRSEQVVLTGLAANNVLVKFVVTNDNGNNLYIDNINLRQTQPTGISEKMLLPVVSVYPNPTNGITNVRLNVTSSQTATLKLVNILGQVVMTKTVALNGGDNTISIDATGFTTGVYNLVIDNGNGTAVVKINVTE